MEFQNYKFVVYLNLKDKYYGHKEKLTSHYEWLFTQASILFASKVDELSKLVDGAEPKRVVVKDLRNRWGSVTKNKTTNLNVNLMKAHVDIIDYIIIHDLFHTEIKGAIRINFGNI